MAGLDRAVVPGRGAGGPVVSEAPEPRVRRIAADIFDVPLGEITADSSPDTIVAWDSAQHLQFVLALEEALGIEFAPEEIELIRSVGTAEELVAARRG